MLSLPATILINPAQYLDPGTGSVILQLLLAVILGAGITTRVFWKKIKTRFGKNTPEITDPDEEEDDE
ncbi:MAG TPA: hypothetical protein VGJ97_07530 [Anaerolineaceae bacterium]